MTAQDNSAELNMHRASVMADTLAHCGIRHVCICPGSRSAPLALACAARENLFVIHTHFDERGAAFKALGIGRATGRAAAVITTSGTAAVNLHPAVVEASNAFVPLLVLSADRPSELQDSGANQTIRQAGLFGGFTRWDFNLPAPSSTTPDSWISDLVSNAMFRTIAPDPGPVHLNVMFREPLVPSPASAAASGPVPPPPRRLHAQAERISIPEAITEAIRQVNRGLLIVGELRNREEREAVYALATALKWPLLPDVGSGLRRPAEDLPIIPNYDLILGASALAPASPPDGIIHVGNRVLSKRLSAYLESSAPEVYIKLQSHSGRDNPLTLTTDTIVADIPAACGAIALAMPTTGSAGEWAADWTRASAHARASTDAFFSGGTLNELSACRSLLDQLPADHGLFLSNSLPVREVDLVGSWLPECVGLNRGASGIDGIIATAAGYAAGAGIPVSVLIGDLACLHDLNSIAMLSGNNAPVTLTVLNNDGGGIFSMLPVAEHQDAFERYFGMPHGLGFESAARLFGINYSRPETLSEFEAAYAKAAASGTPALIEVVCRRDETARGIRDLLASAST